MSFLSVLGTVAKIGETAAAPAAVSAINPAAGLITSLVINAVIKAEQRGGTGSAKKQQVLAELLPVITPIVGTLVQTSNPKVSINPEGVNQAISQIVDGVVSLLNAVQAQATSAAARNWGA